VGRREEDGGLADWLDGREMRAEGKGVERNRFYCVLPPVKCSRASEKF